MGNSKLANRCHIPVADTTRRPSDSDENGILAQIPGNVVAAALQTLPPPTAISPAAAAVMFDTGALGMVQFSIERRQVKHGRHSHYYWAATRAERVDVASAGKP